MLRMKWLAVLSVSLVLCSCNTSIGIYRDTKAGFLWSKGKIQGWTSGGGESGSYQEEYGAPIY